MQIKEHIKYYTKESYCAYKYMEIMPAKAYCVTYKICNYLVIQC
jgi:hypothetical protein